jgi:hypothetical protein
MSALALTVPASMMAAPAASAATTVRVYSNNQGFAGSTVRPANMYFGNGGADFITNLHWSYWDGSHAWASGRVWVLKSFTCHPIANCPYASHYITVYLTVVRVHGTTRYFDDMTVKFWHNGAWHRQTGVFKIPTGGATVPSWVFPNSWPFL